MPFVCYCLCENFFDMATETDGRLCVCVRVCGCACHMARSRKIIFTCQPKIVRKPLPLPRHPPFTDYATCSATGSACSVVMRAKSQHRQSQSQIRNEKWPKMAENLNGVSFEAQRQERESSELLINHLKRSPAATIMCQRSHQTDFNLIK